MTISIPIFTAQLEKSREAVDEANLRAAYAELMADAITNESAAATRTVVQKQTVADWATTPDFPANLNVDAPTTSGSWNLTLVTDANGLVTGVKATHTA